MANKMATDGNIRVTKDHKGKVLRAD
jgi:hypothetical protein